MINSQDSQSQDYTSPLKENGVLRCYNMMWRDYTGGFEEMTNKLAHVKDLGCNAVWLQPFNAVGKLPKVNWNISGDGILKRDAGEMRTGSLYATTRPFAINPDVAVTGYNPVSYTHLRAHET